MAAILRDGFEMGDVLTFDTYGGVAADNTTVRSGVYSAKITYNTGYGEYVLPGGPFSSLYVRACVRSTTNDIQIRLRDNLDHHCFSIEFDTTTKTVQIRDSSDTLQASSTKLWAIDTWYICEISANMAGTPSISVKVDGDVWVEWAGSLTYTSMYRLRLTGGGNVYFDDVGVNDPSGTENNGWLGDGHIIMAGPMGAGDQTGLTPSTGANWQCVDEIPNNADVDYVFGSMDTSYDLYGLANLSTSIPDTDVIKNVWVEATARQEAGGADGISLGVKAGTTEAWCSKIALLTTYTRQRGTYYPANPDDAAAWEESDIDALQAGVKLVA
ncbi:MAG: hypothetical protein JXA37_03580 [Chloroflexia bacterium]|nr:hypothetical protein [Chloroflexia bacterium]